MKAKSSLLGRASDWPAALLALNPALELSADLSSTMTHYLGLGNHHQVGRRQSARGFREGGSQQAFHSVAPNRATQTTPNSET